LGKRLDQYKKDMESEVSRKIEKLRFEGWSNSFDESEKE